MLDIKTIKTYYPTSLHKFDSALLKEYLQYQILSIVFAHKLGKKLSFLGGTCLRIAYGLNRFSEDIDFDNKNMTYSEFEILGKHIEKELESIGFVVEIKFIEKLAFHCHIKFPELLYHNDLSPLKEQKILIQIDTFDQKVDYNPEVFIIDKFDLFSQILVTPKETILSQKLWTITQRKRAKGRDFYDIMYLLQNTSPDMNFLEAKFGTKDIRIIMKKIHNHMRNIDMNELAKDLQPFVSKPSEANKIILFESFAKQKLLTDLF